MPQQFNYSDIYLGKLGSGIITVESFADGEFAKYVNNTGKVSVSNKLALQQMAEAIVNFSYIQSG